MSLELHNIYIYIYIYIYIHNIFKQMPIFNVLVKNICSIKTHNLSQINIYFLLYQIDKTFLIDKTSEKKRKKCY